MIAMRVLVISLMWLVLLVVKVEAGETARLLTVNGRAVDSRSPVAYCFEGDEVSLKLEFLWGSELAEPKARLLVDGGGLVAPLIDEVKINRPAVGKDRHSCWWCGEAVLPLKGLKPDSRLRLQLFTTLKNQESRRVDLTSLKIQLIEHDILKQAFDLAKNRFRLVVFGRMDALKQWLREEKLEFEDYGKDVPVHIPPGVIAMGCAEDSQAPLIPPAGAGLFVYLPEIDTPFEVISETNKQSSLCLVKRLPPVNFNLSADDALLLVHLIKNVCSRP